MAEAFDKTQLLKSLTTSPGVYQMFDAHAVMLYVGKARNLKKRLASYFQKNLATRKTQVLMAQVHDIQVIITESEAEALILESTLIKQHKPRFNVLLRDDKSYPYIYLSSQHDYPRLDFYRGSKRKDGDYFGPYPNVGAARDSLNVLQKLFRVRQCQDSYFANRSRPCLQYQIGRCSAPCVAAVSKEAYQDAVKHSVMFLQGKDQQIIAELTLAMERAAAELHYEQAAKYRDQIASLRSVQAKQYVSHSQGDLDVVALAMQDHYACVQVLSVREGRVLGTHPLYPKIPAHAVAEEVLYAFVLQYYLDKPTEQIPKQIIVNLTLTDHGCIAEALSRAAGKHIKLQSEVRGERAKWQAMATRNAEHNLSQVIFSKLNTQKRLQSLQVALELPVIPSRIECFDISHSSGEGTVASCVVFTEQGALKADYRKFNIDDVTPGDDYAAMRQALTRRYKRRKAEQAQLPDLLLIDGGKGQLTQAKHVLAELMIEGIKILGIAKGVTRKPGFEQLILDDGVKTMTLGSDSLALHLLQQIRDEAHRFAVTGHRARRAKKRNNSPLESIVGIGAKKRRALLNYFGGLQAINQASVEELAKVAGINAELAQRIFAALH